MPRLLILAALSLLLSACGWQLRGASQQLDNIDSVAISARNQHSGFVTSLKRTLAAYDIKTVSESDARYRIMILNQHDNRRSASLSGAGRIAEYLLSTQVTLVLERSDGKTSKPVTLNAERYFDFNENRVLASQHEQQQLQQSINDSLAEQVIDHLQKFSADQHATEG